MTVDVPLPVACGYEAHYWERLTVVVSSFWQAVNLRVEYGYRGQYV